MRIILIALCTIALFFGIALLGAARSAIHEIEAFVLFLIAAVLLSGAGIIEAVNLASKKLLAAIDSAGETLSARDADFAAAPPRAAFAPAVPPQPSPSVAPSYRPAPPPLAPPAFTPPSMVRPAFSPPAAPLDEEVPSIDEFEVADESTGGEEERAQELYEQARSFAKGGDGHAAVSTLRQVVRLFPQSRAAEKAKRTLGKNGATA
ncbi:tetratricopeptide repeat protein [Planctomyces sp. SH-PL14]|uniref:tetratricopeptide repeat protein n=1 Tax=Planctomyces sp. SH-PL14 TaxID=1632864 RepID=UPI00078BF799|nr:tetratricopeptide repeat protein [Planctomyces sp. SH-PL14]AMV20634.1 hypothetical protein VT03_22230 [Planctomyces sp. SH-PL14]